MDKQQWYNERDNRTLRYASRRLDHSRWIALSVSPEYLNRFEGQVAALVAANLLSRMSPSVALTFPDVSVHAALPWAGRSIHEVILAQMRAADPHAGFTARAVNADDYRFHLGRNGAQHVIHGSGWNAFAGGGPSPLAEEPDLNVFGAALAVILAASQLFVHAFDVPCSSHVANAFNWRNESVADAPQYDGARNLGNIWTIGAGSVGTASLYFLSLATRNFTPTLIDMDHVKLHNLDRSPMFGVEDLKQLKVESARNYLQALGINDIRTDDKALHESRLWAERQAGETDLVIAAANEKKVRYYIEAGYPPIQLYGTTGQNWQTALIRHQPFGKACSLCLFPEDAEAAPTSCASAPEPSANPADEKVDAALPFLSFAAGLMTAAEIMKLRIPGYPFSADRVILHTRPVPSFASAPLQHRSGCLCEKRDSGVYRAMLAGSAYQP